VAALEAGAVAHRDRRAGSRSLTAKKAPATNAGRGAARYAAFLRAINVGGRNVTMDRLREAFAGLPGTPVRDVETFIASGNVVFTMDTASAKDIAALERRIAGQLRDALGYEVATFVRAVAALETMARATHFPDAADGHAVHVGFLHDALAPDAAARIVALGDAINSFVVDGRELWWWSKGRISDSGIDGGRMERALGMPMTMRNVNTVRRLAAKYGTPPGGA
jgi:uncharacterized protein (DUF1697 family)